MQRDIIQLAHLIVFIHDCGNKSAKIDELKSAVKDGLITKNEALDLFVEFC